jgi:hypothetical protein
LVSGLAGRDVEGDADRGSERRAGVKAKTPPCPHQLDRPPTKVPLQVVEQQFERALPPDHLGEDSRR